LFHYPFIPFVFSLVSVFCLLSFLFDFTRYICATWFKQFGTYVEPLTTSHQYLSYFVTIYSLNARRGLVVCDMQHTFK
jgi:hypothetical protein